VFYKLAAVALVGGTGTEEAYRQASQIATPFFHRGASVLTVPYRGDEEEEEEEDEDEDEDEEEVVMEEIPPADQDVGEQDLVAGNHLIPGPQAAEAVEQTVMAALRLASNCYKSYAAVFKKQCSLNWLNNSAWSAFVKSSAIILVKIESNLLSKSFLFSTKTPSNPSLRLGYSTCFTFHSR
jgi:hypothetical protein